MRNMTRRKQWGAFTLIELLTVVALIILIVAMAVPNFASMMRERRWSSAVAALQNAILRVKSFCINNRYDHSVEFCQDPKGQYYLRLEAESAFLESVPNLQNYFVMVNEDYEQFIPGWREAFVARRNAWDSKGNRLRTGIIDVNWPPLCPCIYEPDCSVKDPVYYKAGWGHNGGYHPWGTNWWPTHFYYDGRSPYYDKSVIAVEPWTTWSIEERTNLAPFREVDDTITTDAGDNVRIKDNLTIDDQIYLPYDIKVDAALSTNLINFDEWRQHSCVHGWDNTPDLRFDKVGYLIQTQTPEIVLKRDTKYDPEHMRLRVLRGTGRLQTLEGLN